MNKECVFLSTACDFNAMYEFRNKSRAYGIELTPCKSIYEMLQYAIRGCNAILVFLLCDRNCNKKCIY